MNVHVEMFSFLISRITWTFWFKIEMVQLLGIMNSICLFVILSNKFPQNLMWLNVKENFRFPAVLLQGMDIPVQKHYPFIYVHVA